MSRKTIRVDVTADDIAEGVRCMTDACPVARAMNRAMPLPWKWNVGVGPVRAWLSSGGRTTSDVASVMPLSRRAAKFVRDFDRGEPVEPFSFRVLR